MELLKFSKGTQVEYPVHKGLAMNQRSGSFDQYFEVARATEEQILNSNSPFVSALRSCHRFFLEYVFVDEKSMSPFQNLLALHGCMMYLGSIRVAFSGHSAATFPLFRTALEAACYAFLIGQSSELQDAWSQRDDSFVALKVCRGKFTSAVRDTSKQIRTLDWISDATADWLVDAYDAAVDFGGHPNPKAIFPYVRMDENWSDKFALVTLVGLHDARSIETSRSVLASLEYGLLIGVVLMCCLKEPSQDMVKEFNRLNTLKEDLVQEHFTVVLPR